MSNDINQLGKIDLLQTLSRPELEALAGCLKPLVCKPGQQIIRPGEPSPDVFFVIDGAVDVNYRKDRSSAPGIRLGRATCFNRSALLAEDGAVESCRAKGASRLLVLDRQALHAWMQAEPAAACKFFAQAARVRENASSCESLAPHLLHIRTTPDNARTEHDLLGERPVARQAYYGIQTLRAIENYSVTGIRISQFPNLVKALAMVKKAAARANQKLGDLDPVLAGAICGACDDIIDGGLHQHFVVDMIQGGAGTSTNMNANEVIANRALELLGRQRGDYRHLHPNNHVNCSQSTNDAYPTALRLAILLSYKRLVKALSDLAYELKQKSVEFAHILKMGRTQLQDAVPMTLGQEFEAYRVTIKEDMRRLENIADLFREVNLGATAIGTGITANTEYSSLVIEELSRIAQIELVPAENLVEATSDMGAFVTFSSALKRTAIKLSKLCNDLRLLSSGPRAGLNEINLPPMAPGSSIMPGKVNPVIPEMVNQVAYQVIGNDLTITMAAEAGQLQLNVMEPVIALNIFQSVKMLTKAVDNLTSRCIKGIRANIDRCRELMENSIGLVTALNPYIGYENATRIAKKALETNGRVMDIVLQEKLLSKEKLERILSPAAMTRPNDRIP